MYSVPWTVGEAKDERSLADGSFTARFWIVRNISY